MVNSSKNKAYLMSSPKRETKDKEIKSLLKGLALLYSHL
jgi:hypothetical protein